VSKATTKAVSSILATVDEEVTDLEHSEYRDVLGEVIDDLQMRLEAAEAEAE
jgi:hypothetical protein